MKVENNETTAPTENQMNDMYDNAWLDYHADAQQAKQDLSRRYAKMVNTFGSYKKMPDGVKEILKQDYAAHEARWRENGEEMQKRFGANEPDPTATLTDNAAQITKDEQTQKKQDFLEKIQQQRIREKTQALEYTP